MNFNNKHSTLLFSKIVPWVHMSHLEKVSDEEHKFYSYAAIVSEFRYENSENHINRIDYKRPNLKNNNLQFYRKQNQWQIFHILYNTYRS